MNAMRQYIFLLISGFLALSLLAGCQKTKEAPIVKPKVITVETQTFAPSDEPRWISVLGRAESGEAVEVRSQVSGILKKARITEGTA
ncbi:membrane or secreted protein, partial [gut metagenome]